MLILFQEFREQLYDAAEKALLTPHCFRDIVSNLEENESVTIDLDKTLSIHTPMVDIDMLFAIFVEMRSYVFLLISHFRLLNKKF